MIFVDTHCHIHESDYPLPPDDVIKRAHEMGVSKMICVGTSEQSSVDALKFVSGREGIYASIGIHPHEAKDGWTKIAELAAEKPEKLVAVGEIGLDYFYDHSPRDVQINALESQIQTALDYDLPIVFHVRDAFDDFWPIFDNFHGIRGELHSFTDNQANLDKGLERGLYVGVNGISTFTKDATQRELFARVPMECLLLETDAPFLTPVPMRGKINEPGFVSHVATTNATLRGVTLQEIADATTTNASRSFAL